ncbi:MAG TPA: FmdB family zinc ribbon protein, partial [Planctomycetota bacterium]|nr:FmdB family zinc ribbon protein [Planctomycetota bacterium]
PTYDYECGKCGGSFEIFQKITDPPEEKCPSCGAKKLKRLFGGGAGFIFKGSGFYITDYRSEDYKKRAKAESEGASKSSSEKSTDSKPSKDSTGTKPASASATTAS